MIRQSVAKITSEIGSRGDKRAPGGRIVKSKDLFEVRPRRSKPASIPQGSIEDAVTLNDPSEIVTLTAQAQQILV
jgi:hypothetical protein